MTALLAKESVIPKLINEATADRIWHDLSQVIVAVQKRNLGVGLSFMELHRKAYDLVINKHGDILFDGYKQLLIDHLRSNIRKSVLEADNNRFLETLAHEWESFKTTEQMNREIMMYFDQSGYVNDKRYSSIYSLALKMFHQEIIDHPEIKSRLKASLLRLIGLERTKEIVEWMCIKSTCQMLLELSQDRLCYEQVFENAFLLETREFYEKLCQKIIVDHPAGAYALAVKEYFAEEIDRAGRYLDKQTGDKVELILADILLSKHMISILKMDSGFQSMVDNDKIDELRFVYELLDRLNDGPMALAEIMGNDLRRRSMGIVESIDATTFIQGFLDLMKQFERIITEAFSNNPLINKRLQADFRYAVNLNAKAPEFISIYVDEKLKKGIKAANEAETEAALNNAIWLFRCLNEKDLFERYYKQHLARRLLFDRSGSDDAEKSMLMKLKDECGVHYTMKLEGMFRDMQSSTDLMNSYRDSFERLEGAELSVRVLATVNWPANNKNAPCWLPHSLQNLFGHFQKFYLAKYNGRRICLNCAFGNADVKASFYGDQNVSTGSQEKIFNVTTYQMLLLLIFNKHSKITFQQLLLETQIPEKELKRCLQSLADGKLSQRVLIRTGAGKEIESADEFSVNENLTSKLKRIKVQMGSVRVESETEVKDTRNKVDESRKHELEAAIVRIMKARKSLEHNELFTEVCAQVKARFLPDPAMLKKRVESLIEREFLARTETNNKLYKYVA